MPQPGGGQVSLTAGNLSAVVQQLHALSTVAAALRVAAEWRQKEAQMRTPYLLIRILALTRAYELEYQHAPAQATSPIMPLLSSGSLSRRQQRAVATFGKGLRAYGEFFPDSETVQPLSDAFRLGLTLLCRRRFLLSSVNKHLSATCKPWRGALAWKLHLLEQSESYRHLYIPVGVLRKHA